jgi:hypothetical protein
VKHAFVQKEQGRQRLRLRGGCDPQIGRQVSEELPNFLPPISRGWRFWWKLIKRMIQST